MNENVLFFLKFKKDLQFFYDTLSLDEALRLIRKHGFTAVPVINGMGEYLGTVTEGDFLWDLLEHGSDPQRLENSAVRDLIRKNFMPAVNINVTMEQLLETSLHQNFVPVVDDRSIFIGIVTRQALLRYYGRPVLEPKLTPELNELFPGRIQIALKR